MHTWDYFVAHAADTVATAKALSALLEQRGSKVFLDRNTLAPGEKWPSVLEQAQRQSLFTLVLVSPLTAGSTYEQVEIAIAVQLATHWEQFNSTALGAATVAPSGQAAVIPAEHHVIPIVCGDAALPYGLGIFQSLRILSDSSLNSVADALVGRLLHKLGPCTNRAPTPSRTAWEEYDHLFEVGGYRLPYLPVLGGHLDSPRMLSIGQVGVQLDPITFSLPSLFEDTFVEPGYQNRPSCRLVHYSLGTDRLDIVLSETSYEDYLKSGEHLDDTVPTNPNQTFRDIFGSYNTDSASSLRPFALTNICGTGVFIRTSDNYVVATIHSERSRVYPGRATFSASGTMRWGASPSPFTETLLKSMAEINHQIELSKLSMIAFGADARKLYFQFGFVERTATTLAQLRTRMPLDVELFAIPFFSAEDIIQHVFAHCWEPAAEATLLAMCAYEHGAKTTEQFLQRHINLWDRHQMQDEWDYRSTRSHHLPDLSVRYPRDSVESESEVFVGRAVTFLAGDIANADILEVGCGTGRVTRRLVELAASVTAIDLCPRMLRRNRARLGTLSHKVVYVEAFGQEYTSGKLFDVAIFSLVLIHNVDDSNLLTLIQNIATQCRVIVILEDVTVGRRTSRHTKLRSVDELVDIFRVCGCTEDRANRTQTSLFQDTIALMRFCTNSAANVEA